MKSSGSYSLIGCTVAPAFEFSDLELAPKSWKPSKFNIELQDFEFYYLKSKKIGYKKSEI